MKKYIFTIISFFIFWIFLISKYIIEPRISIEKEKILLNKPDFFIYKFSDLEPEKEETFESLLPEIPNVTQLTEFQSLKVNKILELINKNWVKFIQYNENDFCFISTNIEEKTINFNYCNSNTFKRSLYLSINNIDFNLLFKDIEIDFIFKINAYDLKEKLVEKDSKYIDII